MQTENGKKESVKETTVQGSTTPPYKRRENEENPAKVFTIRLSGLARTKPYLARARSVCGLAPVFHLTRCHRRRLLGFCSQSVSGLIVSSVLSLTGRRKCYLCAAARKILVLYRGGISANRGEECHRSLVTSCVHLAKDNLLPIMPEYSGGMIMDAIEIGQWSHIVPASQSYLLSPVPPGGTRRVTNQTP
ncbi:hypothetical protein FA95DRAFT_1343288 [Auriscalpium vulgare]|uniref:Uncharacterized protein n=1 Tax=Auriscalpium vulgare TaxID=40419 RepID=A0ACB8RRA9_9AGAM|nr:hypothetical protein FA95DRAFT_1343288 [Auriscalpium vulgare]